MMSVKFKNKISLLGILMLFSSVLFGQTLVDRYNDASGYDFERDGITFRITGVYDLTKPSDGNLFGSTNYRLTIVNYSAIIPNPVRINYKGKSYSPNDFNGALNPYFDAVKVQKISVKALINGLKDCQAISVSLGSSGSSNTLFCEPVKDAKIAISDIEVWDLATTGILELQSKINSLENEVKIQAAKKEEEQKKQNASTSGSATKATAPTGTTVPTTAGVPTSSGAAQTTTQSVPSAKQQAYNLASEGYNLYLQGNYKEALAKYTDAEKLDPTNVSIREGKKNVINAMKTQAYNDNLQAQTDIKVKTAENAVNTAEKIATDVLQEKGGRFGLTMMTVYTSEIYGITWGNADNMHINFTADFSSFNTLGMSIDMFGFDWGKSIMDGGSGYMGIFPAMGFALQNGETDENGDPIIGSPDFSSFQIGLTGIIESDGFYLKGGYLYDVLYFSGENPSPGAVMLGIGFGIN